MQADQILVQMEKLLATCQELDTLLEKRNKEHSKKKKEKLVPEIDRLLIEFHNIQEKLAEMNMTSIGQFMESQPETLQERFQSLTEDLRLICESCQIRIENGETIPKKNKKEADEVIFRIMEESKR